MSNGKKTVITIESWQRTSIGPRQPSVVAWCSECSAETTMFSPEEFARIHGTVPRMVYRRIEGGSLHFIETQTGALLICKNSFAQPAIKQIERGDTI